MFDVRSDHEHLDLDFQNLSYNAVKDTITIGIIYTGNCPYFTVKFVNQNQLERSGIITPTKQLRITTNNLMVSFPAADLGFDEVDSQYFNIIAVDENGAICSDEISCLTFYQIERRGIHIRIKYCSYVVIVTTV